jgi:hypothetical protein
MSDLTNFKTQLAKRLSELTFNHEFYDNRFIAIIDKILSEKSESGLCLAIVKNREDLTGCRRIDECPYDEDHACKDCEFRQWFAEVIKE